MFTNTLLLSHTRTLMTELDRSLGTINYNMAKCWHVQDDALVKPFDPASFNVTEYEALKKKSKECMDKCKGKPEVGACHMKNR